MDNSFNIKNGMNFKALTADPVSAVSGDLYYNSILKTFRYYNGTAWKTVGSGSGGLKNYISNPDAEADTSGWATYANIASSVPVDGTGGSPNVTFTRSLVSPLRETASFIFTKDAVNRQGQGVSSDFTIDVADQGKVLGCSFDYLINSGTYADNDLVLYVYDITNSQMIQTVGFEVKNVVSGLPATKLFSFQTNTNSTSYRLIMHVASTSTAAYSIKMDNVFVGPQTNLTGSISTDPVQYTPNVTGLNNLSNEPCFWHREGKFMVCSGTIVGDGIPQSFSISLPPGHAIDYSVTGLDARNKVGEMTYVSGNGSSVFPTPGEGPWPMYYDSGDTTVPTRVFASRDLSGSSFFPIQGNSIFAPSTRASFIFKVPIKGWSSESAVIGGGEGRVVAASYKLTGGQTVTGTNTLDILNFSTLEKDTHGAVTTGSAWKFTAPVSGIYNINVSIELISSNYSNSGKLRAYVYKNGSPAAMISSYTTINAFSMSPIFSGATEIELKAGDYIDVRGFESSSGDSASVIVDTVRNRVAISRISGPESIMAAEKIAASYRFIGSQPAMGGVLVFNTKDVDTHNAYNTSTGEYICPRAGNLHVSAQITAICAAGSADIAIQKNGSDIVKTITNQLGSFNSVSIAERIIPVVAGDTIRLRTSGAGWGIDGANGNYLNYLTISLE